MRISSELYTYVMVLRSSMYIRTPGAVPKNHAPRLCAMICLIYSILPCSP